MVTKETEDISPVGISVSFFFGRGLRMGGGLCTYPADAIRYVEVARRGGTPTDEHVPVVGYIARNLQTGLRL